MRSGKWVCEPTFLLYTHKRIGAMESVEEIIDKVRELITPLFDEQYLHLVDVELRGHQNNRVLTIYADTEQGITLDEITYLTRQISELLDVHDVIPGSFRLEVSSPGVSRPLKFHWQFRKNIGRFLKIKYMENEKKQKVSGQLEAVTEDSLVLKVGQKQVTVPLTAIQEARVEIRW